MYRIKQKSVNYNYYPAYFKKESLRLYHYAGNNPVKYIDPDGRKFVIKIENEVYVWDNEANTFSSEKTKKVTNIEFVNQVKESFLYIKQSEKGASFINEISKSDRIIEIKSSTVDLFSTSGFISQNGIISFNPNYALNISGDKNDTTEISSAALLLCHEIVHAYDHIINHNYTKLHNRKYINNDFPNYAEANAVLQTDLVARELNEPLRFIYKGIEYPLMGKSVLFFHTKGVK